ncbi:MAG: hypothetical protein KKH44_07805 [Bacteroidetes bacterium]|nr:hypothetical protein [Bacteroidota bacterium]
MKEDWTEERIKEFRMLERLLQKARSLNDGNLFIENVQEVIRLSKILTELNFATRRESFIGFLMEDIIQNKNQATK